MIYGRFGKLPDIQHVLSKIWFKLFHAWISSNEYTADSATRWCMSCADCSFYSMQESGPRAYLVLFVQHHAWGLHVNWIISSLIRLSGHSLLDAPQWGHFSINAGRMYPRTRPSHSQSQNASVVSKTFGSAFRYAGLMSCMITSCNIGWANNSGRAILSVQ